MQTFQQIQFQIGSWSAKNFGCQETPYLRVRRAGNIERGRPRAKGDVSGLPLGDPVVVELGALAPLMGMVEELGELAEANAARDRDDAVGDIAVYLCDYLCREGLAWPERFTIPDADQYIPPLAGLMLHIGKLFRCHLKRHQRIRGMENDEAFHAARMDAIRGIVWHLEDVSRNADRGTNLLVILNATWNGIVSKRDWRADAAGGGGHSHEG